MNDDNLNKEESINLICEDLLQLCNEHVTNIIYDILLNDLLPNFIIIQIKCKNITFLQLLWVIFKKYDYSRVIINKSMIDLILSSFDDNIVFFEIFKWYEEFSYSDESITPNVTIALYTQARKFPKLKSYLHTIINRINNKDAVYHRTIFFIHDEVDIIKPFFTKDPEITKGMLIRSYQYNAINTLKQLQYKNKTKFFDMEWYLLDPDVFNKHMIDSKRNPYEDEKFSIDWMKYICSALRWDYLPLIINHMTQPMWKILIASFYKGYITIPFIQILFHQMKINNIPYEKLQSRTLLFCESDIITYLKQLNIFHLFINKANKLKLMPKPPSMTVDALEVTVLSAVSMMVIFCAKDISALSAIVYDSSLHLSTKYYDEIKYIDNLLNTNQLGWDENNIKSYTNFKSIMLRIIEEANILQDLYNEYNSFIPIYQNHLPYAYQLRYINKLLNKYKNLKMKLFQSKYEKQYNILITLRQDYIKRIRKDTNTNLDPSVVFTPPENSTIYDQFKNLIENSENVEFIHEDRNQFWINKLSDNKLIQRIVRNMLQKYHVAIQEITPVLYNYYFQYATEEHFFLE
jgi:hypothetical protein